MPSRKPWNYTLLTAGLVLWSGSIPAPAFQLGSRDSQEWIQTLERPERVAGLKIDQVIQSLGLKPGMIVADIGAGTGVFSRAFAKAVSPGGKVYATDVDQGLVSFIAQKVQQENIGNLQAILGKFEDPLLPSKDVDLAFFHDVMHHIEHREAYLKTLSSYLKPTGRIALIEIDPANPQHPHQGHVEQEHGMQLSKESVSHWLAALGFYPAKEFDLFKGEKWFVVYERNAAPPADEMGGMDMHMH